MLEPTNYYVIVDRRGTTSVAHWHPAAGVLSRPADSDRSRPQFETELSELETLYSLVNSEKEKL